MPDEERIKEMGVGPTKVLLLELFRRKIGRKMGLRSDFEAGFSCLRGFNIISNTLLQSMSTD
jgi:hypothetical protein